MTDKKSKEDKVISMEDFKRTEEALEEGSYETTVEDIIDRIKEHNISELVAIGMTDDGKLAFYTTTGDYGQIMFLCEAYKKLIMEGVQF